MELTLLIPELVWPEPGDLETLAAIDCRALETLLARSRFTRSTRQALEATLADAFGFAERAPYAPFRLLGESIQLPESLPDGYWLCADPVHLRFHHERLILADGATLDIKLDEAIILSGELNQHLADTGIFHVASADRWYLQLFKSNDLGTFDVPPRSAIAGRSIERQLPETPQTTGLRKLLNEAQMILHSHPANAAREESGRMPINSLWLWGAGTLPCAADNPFDGVWSDHPLAIGLGRTASVPDHPTPPDLAALLTDTAPASRHLVFLEDLLAPVQYQDGNAYRNALQTQEKRWFAPLRKALARRRINRLHLVAPTAYGVLRWECRPGDRWKLWRRAQSLATVAQYLAKSEA